MLRKTVFWLHLAAGVTAGLVIAIMAFTGTTIAFEKEILAWAERDVRRIEPPPDAERLPFSEILQRARATAPELKLTGASLYSNPAVAVTATFGRDEMYYINPYSGDVRPSTARSIRDFLHFMESVHRQLGFTSAALKPTGRALTGACNGAFLFLTISGLYLWWPRHWSWRGVKAVAVLNVRLFGRARDFHWHNVIGLWAAPALIVLTLTALPMSYRWADALVYRITGTSPKVQESVPRTPASPAGAALPGRGTKRPGYDDFLAKVQSEIPDWTEITFRLSAGRGAGNAPLDATAKTGTGTRPSGIERERHAAPGDQPRGAQTVNVTVRGSNQWPLFSATTFALDSSTGAILNKDIFADQNAGRRLRSWARFLHTGEALGWPGKLTAALAALGALILVWTGFALAYRRLFSRRQPAI